MLQCQRPGQNLVGTEKTVRWRSKAINESFKKIEHIILNSNFDFHDGFFDSLSTTL